MATSGARSASSPAPPFGTIPDCHRWQFAGCLYATRRASASLKPSCVPTLNATPAQILGWFVQRWSMETTLQETREHLGVETQRQWSDLAILRTTPALLGLFSLITIWANTSSKLSQSIRPRDAAWYAKSELTFSDAIAAVRRVLWAHPNISMSGKPRDMVEIPRPLFDRFTQTLCYAT